MLDSTDSALLRLLQRDATLTTQQLSDQLNLSPSQIGRRKLRLEAEGYVLSYHARLDAKRLALSVQAFIQVQTTGHSPDAHRSFVKLAERQSGITAAWTMTGDADYMLRVYCADLAALNRLVHDVLLPHASVARVQTQIVMDQFKADAPLPA